MEKKKTIILKEAAEKKEKVEVEDFKEIKIVGISRNFNKDGKDYYIGYDGKKFFLFTGSTSTKPSSDYIFNDDLEHLWDDVF